jgi:hypothetical protein
MKKLRTKQAIDMPEAVRLHHKGSPHFGDFGSQWVRASPIHGANRHLRARATIAQ